MTGRWHEELSNDMVEASKIGEFSFLDHLQPLPSLYSSKKGNSDPLSSELRNFTGHLGSIVVRLPNPRDGLSAFRMAEVVLGIREITLIVSSELPSSFLGGTIQTECASPTYPNDPRDICCGDQEERSDLVVVFRMQVSLTDLQMKTLSGEAYNLPQVLVDNSYADLITPTTLTMMLSLESALPELGAAIQSKSLIVSVLLQHLESNIDIRSVNGALETFSYHAANIVDYLNLSLSTSDQNATRKEIAQLDCSKSTTRVCVHVPQITLRMWGDCQNTKARNACGHMLLCQVRVNQFEFGSELMNRNGDEGAVHKCVVGNFDVGLRGKGDHDTSAMQEIVSLGVDESPYTHLATKACASCFGDNLEPFHPAACFLLRSETYSSTEKATSIEITKPLVINVDINAIEFSINAGVETLLSPSFDSSPSSAEISQCPLGSHMWECGYNLASMIVSSSSRHVESSCASQEVDTSVPESASAFFRFALSRVFVVVPRDPASVSLDAAIDAFGFLGDAQIVTGDVCTTEAPGIIQRNCGVGDQTWKTAVPASDKRGKFHALKSTHALVEIVGGDGVVSMCSNSINWSVPAGIQGQSCLPPVDLNKTMELASVMMNLGMPMSSLYFKLYKLAPANVTKQRGVGVTTLHDMIGLYHSRVWDAFNKFKAEINELQMAVYTKENERIGAMALGT